MVRIYILSLAGNLIFLTRWRTGEIKKQTGSEKNDKGDKDGNEKPDIHKMKYYCLGDVIINADLYLIIHN
ncbi:MAG: hypothetical protein A3J76_01035 [Candidatus Moranbacteria bacterium RBG_13_45_13]|nr:MAG: hypothetical protein A3J76_01035 [Candidatus Moranbacteria bacterium RBG_13_45_13]